HRIGLPGRSGPRCRGPIIGMRIPPCDDPGVLNQNGAPVRRGFRPDYARFTTPEPFRAGAGGAGRARVRRAAGPLPPEEWRRMSAVSLSGAAPVPGPGPFLIPAVPGPGAVRRADHVRSGDLGGLTVVRGGRRCEEVRTINSVGITCSTGWSEATPSIASMSSWTTAVPIRRGL